MSQQYENQFTETFSCDCVPSQWKCEILCVWCFYKRSVSRSSFFRSALRWMGKLATWAVVWSPLRGARARSQCPLRCPSQKGKTQSHFIHCLWYCPIDSGIAVFLNSMSEGLVGWEGYPKPEAVRQISTVWRKLVSPHWPAVSHNRHVLTIL